MFLFCFASRHQNHKASRSTEVCWTLILEVLSHRVKMRYMRAWIIYITLHYIAPWHANVKNWIVSTIFSPVHRLNIVLGAVVYFLNSIPKMSLRQANGLGQNGKKCPLPQEPNQGLSQLCQEPWLWYKALCLTKTDVEQTSRFISFFLTPSSCFPKLQPTAPQTSALAFLLQIRQLEILANPSAPALLPT